MLAHIEVLVTRLWLGNVKVRSHALFFGVGRNQLVLLVVVLLRDVVFGQRISRSKPIADECCSSRLDIQFYMESRKSED
jgi:hypothetical protein